MSEQAFEGTVLEGKERRYTILNERDYKEHVYPSTREKFEEVLDDVLLQIEQGREYDGKKPFNNYIVINVDEPYADEVLEILKRHGHWD